MRYQWLLFDADNTLFDYDRAEACALQTSFEQIGLPYQEAHRQTYRAINAALWEAFERGEIDQDRIKSARFQRLFQQLGVAVEAEAFGRRYLENLAQVTVMVEGAVDGVLAASFPLTMRWIRSASSSTSSRMCDETRIVRPSAASPRMTSRR